MAGKYIISTLLLIVLVEDVRTQYFDFFQGFQPILSYQTSRPTTRHYAVESTTKRHKVTTIRRPENRYEHTTRKPVISYSFDESDVSENNRQTSKEKQHKRKQTTLAPIFNSNFYTTTVKPVRKTTKATTSHRNVGVGNYGENSRVTKPKDSSRITNNERLEYAVDDNDNTQGNRWYERPLINNIGDDYYSTSRPRYEATNRPAANNYNNHDSSSSGSRPSVNNQNYDSRPSYDYNSYTTKRPFYNRPGVKPAVVENRPPITNRPVTKRPSYSVFPRPTDAGSITFPGDDASPEVISGPDEDYMSDAEKKRYIEISERMCDKYKALTTKQLQAIPLVPSPEPVQVNVSSCSPITVPLVVGGKVVSIRDFPHMALLGWVKLEGGGYSWKCGGSLISEQYILTAAHCAYQERDNTVITGPPRVVQLGSSYLDDPGALVVKVSAVIRHPKYKASRSYYDLALLKLATPVTFSEVVKPACLGVPPPVGRPIVATGWGQTQVGGELSQELRSVSLPIWDIQRCSQVLGSSRKMPTGPSSESQVCAGDPKGGRDTCQGDSGGPAQMQDGCVWRVVAVTSVGRSCAAPNTPGLYSIVHRAFVAAQVFGGHRNNKNNNQNNNNQENNNYNPGKNDSQRSDNNQGSRNYRNDDSNDGNEYSYYQQNNNRKSEGTQTNTNSKPDYNNDYNRQNSNHGYDTSHVNSESNHRSDNQQHDYGYNNYDSSRPVNSNDNYRRDSYSGYNNQQQDDNRNNNQYNNYRTSYNNNDNGYNRQHTDGIINQGYYDSDRVLWT